MAGISCKAAENVVRSRWQYVIARIARPSEGAAAALSHMTFHAWKPLEEEGSAFNSAQRILIGYVLISLAGALGLWVIEGTSGDVTLIDHLFTSVSAVSTTGLTTLAISQGYSCAGQAIILVLIQIGGLGYMTVAAVLISRLDYRRQTNEEQEAETDFALPPEVGVRAFAKTACIVTASVEIVGAAILYFAFRADGIDQPLWNAIFHSVSAFCTSGLSLFPDSFETHSGNALVLIPISIMSFLGAIGFLVAWDVARSLRRGAIALNHTNTVVLLVFVPLLAASTILLYFTDGRLAGITGSDRWLNAFFAAMTSSTTVGFSTLPTTALSGAALVLVVGTMVIGAAPAGTSGGIKTTTAAVLTATMVSSLRQQDETRLFGWVVSREKIRAASTTLVFYVSLMLVATFILAAIEPDKMVGAVFFEVVSALGTIGLSFGVSGEMSVAGQLIIVVLMIAGRVGILAFGAALLSEGDDEGQLEQAERV